MQRSRRGARDFSARGSQHGRVGLREFPRRGLLPPLRARRGARSDRARRVRDQLHALPGRGEPGTTQAIFEFQTLITQLTAIEVANASMYDGASAAAEAVLMARRLMPRRAVVALSRALWPEYRATIRTYLSALAGVEIVEVPFDDATGATDIAALDRIANDRLLCTVTGYPNAFGVDRAARSYY